MANAPEIQPMALDTKDKVAPVVHAEHFDTEINEKTRGVNTQLDDAAALLAEIGERDFSAEEKKRVLRKIDLWVCLPMCIVYLLQQLDKQSVSNAAVFDLRESTNLTGTEYPWLTSGVYVMQLICQPLSSYALIVFPVKYWVMFNMISWSIVTICTAAAKNFAGLMVARLLLGAFEATILPSFVLITQMWWTRREQSYRTIAYQIANSLAAIFGPLLSWAIGHAGGAIKPYQGIFLFMGAISLGFAPLVWYLMPNSPTTAKFLRHGEDRLIAIQRLRENNTGTKSSKWKWDQFWETYRDPKTYMWAGMYICCSIPSGGIGAFGGIITKGFGFSSFESILMQIPTGAIGIVTLLITIHITNKIKLRFPVIAILCLLPIAGASALIKVPRKQTGALLTSYYVAYPFAALQPLLYSWANLNAAGSTKRVVLTATIFVFQCAGNIIGPQVYLKREDPYYHTGLTVDIACWGVLCVLACSMGLYLKYLNKRQEEKRASMGLPRKLKDMSIMAPQEAEQYRVELAAQMREEGLDERRLWDHAFDDLTDFKNPMFIYVL